MLMGVKSLHLMLVLAKVSGCDVKIVSYTTTDSLQDHECVRRDCWVDHHNKHCISTLAEGQRQLTAYVGIDILLQLVYANHLVDVGGICNRDILSFLQGRCQVLLRR